LILVKGFKETFIHYLDKTNCYIWSRELGNWKTNENRLLIVERKIMRRFFGPIKDSETNEWRIRKNKEVESLYNIPNIEAIRNNRL